jgi:hypothetical protein
MFLEGARDQRVVGGTVSAGATTTPPNLTPADWIVAEPQIFAESVNSRGGRQLRADPVHTAADGAQTIGRGLVMTARSAWR